MAKIHTLKITNFRGISNFEQVFGMSNFVCLIGRGDSGKTTILDAISYVLCGSWNLQIYDTDFNNADVKNPIEIEATIYEVPKKLLNEDKYGLYIRGLDESSNTIHDSLEDSHTEALTIRLTVEKDLEPRWCVINERQEPIEIRASDRASLNVFLVSDYIDRHFSWNIGSPLYSLLKEEKSSLYDGKNLILDELREAKEKIDGNPFSQLSPVLTRVQQSASEFGVDLTHTTTTIDFKDISLKDGRISLHENNIPFRLKGKGSKRLASVAIQTELAKSGGILLLDEIEQGLEPDRAQHLAKTLRENNKGQVFITTHSRDVLVELYADNLFRMAKNATELFQFDGSLQAVLRVNPEAFFAKKVLVCEGETEIGILKAINSYRIESGRNNASFIGVRFAIGKGSNLIKYAEGFLKAGYPTCIFCDSDDPTVNNKKEELTEKGILIIDSEDRLCLEQQIFKDLPWDGVKQLIEYQITHLNGAVGDSVKERYKPYGALEPNWIEVENINLRKVLGETAKQKSWFKNIGHGESLGKTCCTYLERSEENRLKKQFFDLSTWIDNA